MVSFVEKIESFFSTYNPEMYDFDYDFVVQPDIKMQLKNNGFAVVKNVVSENEIQIIWNAFDLLSKSKSFYEVDGFITSANYGFEIQKEIHQVLKEVNAGILDKFFLKEKIYHDLLNVLVIKFNKDKNEFYPHQDIPLIDEASGPTIFAWIPTTDITEINGALMVLPGSHKWFRWQRTHAQVESPLKNVRNEIFKMMVPVYVNKGDLILFDNSLLHASAPNLSHDTRVAMNTGFAPNQFPLIHYQRIAGDNKKIEKYTVDEDFWLKGYYLDPNSVPACYHPPVVEKIKHSNYLSKRNFMNVLKRNT